MEVFEVVAENNDTILTTSL